MNATSPLVSIGVTSYNNGRYLEELLESIRCQTYSAVELLIVDDGSSDHSVEVIQSWLARTGYPATFVQHGHNRGIVAAVNTLRERAKGEFFSLTASDDTLAPTMVAEIVAEFERQGPDCAVVYSDCRLMDLESREVAPSFLQFFDPAFAAHPPEGNLIVPLLTGFYLPGLTAIMRRSTLDETGEFDASLFSEDLDMWLRLSRKFRFAYLPANLGAYRVHSTSAISSQRLSLNDTYFRIYRKKYFQGEAEWAAARRMLVEQAEHYYANKGPDTPGHLWYALRETNNKKLGFFWLMARLGLGYDAVKRLLELRKGRTK